MKDITFCRQQKRKSDFGGGGGGNCAACLKKLTHWHTQPAVRRAEPSMSLLIILALCQ
jgi:hypothetical protein